MSADYISLILLASDLCLLDKLRNEITSFVKEDELLLGHLFDNFYNILVICFAFQPIQRRTS